MNIQALGEALKNRIGAVMGGGAYGVAKATKARKKLPVNRVARDTKMGTRRPSEWQRTPERATRASEMMGRSMGAKMNNGEYNPQRGAGNQRYKTIPTGTSPQKQYGKKMSGGLRVR